jgi:phosphoribosylaminoimidazole-succinocarboxamide synthase
MREPIPYKGAVLTQMSAFWFQKLSNVFPSHYVSASTREILDRIPGLKTVRDQIAGRAMLVLRAEPVPFECVVRGYITGSAWAEYRERGTLAGEPLASGLVESARLDPPIFSPATKAEAGHDINVTVDAVVEVMGSAMAARLREASFAIYSAGRGHAAERGIIIADTKFEFGTDPAGTLRLIDEVLTPDSSRFWPADRYDPGHAQPSFDKQPLRDYLAALKAAGLWDGEAPPPSLPPEVVEATSRRYLEAFRLLTGRTLEQAL